MSQQFHLPNLLHEQVTFSSQCFDRDAPVFRPCQQGRIERLLTRRKANILTGEYGAFGIGEASTLDVGWSFAKGFPGTRAIDRLSIDVQPTPNLQQYRLI